MVWEILSPLFFSPFEIKGNLEEIDATEVSLLQGLKGFGLRSGPPK